MEKAKHYDATEYQEIKALFDRLGTKLDILRKVKYAIGKKDPMFLEDEAINYNPSEKAQSFLAKSRMYWDRDKQCFEHY